MKEKNYSKPIAWVSIKAFIKKLFTYSTLLNIIILFIVGLLSRFLVNNFLSIDETFILLLGISPLKVLFNESYLSMKIINDNMSLIKPRPRDYIINNDHEIKDKCKRKLQWIVFNQFESKYSSYREFKREWNSDDKLINQIKDKYEEKRYKVLLFKNTFLRIVLGKK